MQREKSLIHEGKRHLPLPSGPYTVGCFDYMTSYSKFGVFVRLYYPCKERDIFQRHLQWPQWIPHEQYINGYARRLGFPPSFYKILHRILVGNLYIPAVWHGELKSSDEKYPVVVFSHGLSGFRTTYSSICMELASRGFIVAAVEHRDHSASASFYQKSARESAIGRRPGSDLSELENVFDCSLHFLNEQNKKSQLNSRIEELGPFCYTKEWMLYVSPKKENEMHLRTQQLKFRGRECSEVLDLSEGLNYGRYVANVLDHNCNAQMFKNKLDLSKSFFIGHSMGGATGICCLGSDSRFKAGVFLDPWMYPFFDDWSCFSKLSQPCLCLLIESFQTKESMKVAKELRNSNGLVQFLLLKGALHRDVSDAPFVPKHSFSLSTLVGRRLEKFSTLDITIDIILQFFSSQVGGSFLPLAASSKLEKLKEHYLLKEDFSSIEDK